MDRDDRSGAVDLETPRVPDREEVEADAVVSGEILHAFRRAFCGKVGRTCANNPAHAAEVRGDEPAIRERADAKRQIHLVLQQIDDAVTECHSDVDLGVRSQELGKHRQDVKAPEHHGGRHDQFTARLSVFTGRGTLSFVELLEDSPARCDVAAPRLGQRQLAGRADQEPRLQRRLQFRYFAADRRERHPKLAAGG